MALFKSPHKNFRQKVRGELLTRHPVTGDVIDRKPTIAADFGSLGQEQSVYDPVTGTVVTVADIRGGFFDSDEAQTRLGWSDEEREMVERKLREIQQTRPDYVQEIVPVRVMAPLPWTTYGDLSADDILEYAPKLRLIAESLRYERENENRPKLVSGLEALLYANEIPDPGPLMEVPEEDMLPMEPQGVALQQPPRSTKGGIPVDTPGFQMLPGDEVVDPARVSGGRIEL